MTLTTDQVRSHWERFSTHLEIILEDIIYDEIKYWVYETAAAGTCPDEDEDQLVEILSSMAEWKVHISFDGAV